MAGRTTAKQGAGTLTTVAGSQPLVVANADRRALWVSNADATNAVWLGLGVAAAINAGVRVGPAETRLVDGGVWAGAVNVIPAAGTPIVGFAEV